VEWSGGSLGEVEVDEDITEVIDIVKLLITWGIVVKRLSEICLGKVEESSSEDSPKKTKKQDAPDTPKKAKKKGKKVIKTLEVGIVYFGKEPRINGVDRISKPSRRIYQKSKDIRMFKSGFGNTVLSTPKGILLDVDAKKHKVGGEVLFKIW
jgi:ribosomal protein S8